MLFLIDLIEDITLQFVIDTIDLIQITLDAQLLLLAEEETPLQEIEVMLLEQKEELALQLQLEHVAMQLLLLQEQEETTFQHLERELIELLLHQEQEVILLFLHLEQDQILLLQQGQGLKQKER